jgi:hypothetical protein
LSDCERWPLVGAFTTGTKRPPPERSGGGFLLTLILIWSIVLKMPVLAKAGWVPVFSFSRCDLL